MTIDPNWLGFPLAAMMAPAAKNNIHDKPEEPQSAGGVTMGQLILAIVGAAALQFFALVGWTASDRLASEKRITQIEERQHTVRDVELPAIRAEIAELHRVDHEREGVLADVYKRISEQQTELLKHQRDDNAKFGAVRPFRGQQIP